MCSLPEAMLKLKLDPTKEHRSSYTSDNILSVNVPSKQHDLLLNVGSQTNKITRAPPGCPYNNPLLLHPRRMTTDSSLASVSVSILVSLNTALVDNDHFEIPLIRNVLDSLQGCTIFGEFDLAEAYLQFPLHPESQPYTAFTWGTEQYMFTCCPFGFQRMPSHFQRIMSYVFRDLPFTFPYFDNIPFGSRHGKNMQHTHKQSSNVSIHTTSVSSLLLSRLVKHNSIVLVISSLNLVLLLVPTSCPRSRIGLCLRLVNN